MMFPSPVSHSSNNFTLVGVPHPNALLTQTLFLDRIFRFVMGSGPVGMMEKMMIDDGVIIDR